MNGIVAIIAVIASATLVIGDVSHVVHQQHGLGDGETTTPQPPPHPYIFSYTAGRFAGHTDRAHSEIGDGAGTVRGAYSYIDPRQEIRSVEYVADKDGFRPILSHPIAEQPRQTEAVKLATNKHIELYNHIAETHANPELNAALPRDSASVAYAKQRHHTLFDRIAADHARIGAELEAQRALFESTSEISVEELESRGGQIPVEVRQFH